MTFKIAVYGVRSNEVAYFNDLNKYDYTLTLISENLTHENVETAKGHDAVLLRANNVADKQNLDILNSYGIKYVFSRTVGIGHVDLSAAAANNQIVANVPGYSPRAVGELAFILGATQLRHVVQAADNTYKGDFVVAPELFATEIHDVTVGIFGTGSLGRAEAKLWHALGANVIAYDVYENEEAKEYLTYTSENEVLSQADLVSLHVPHIPGKNDQYFNVDYINQMKKGAILVNTARAEITDENAIIAAVKSGQLGGFATDVVSDERMVIGKDFSGKSTPVPVVDEMRALYPKVLITPHIGSYTGEALTDMISISFDNFHDVLESGNSKNIVKS
ncbi:NAD(P)-dependent oxidoreductase [Weissella viridescens]|uniref:NAD(P)-dependent oxidoreductase n=1 Tax=Weissella viridescens TaxID=1629 RepID=UPI0040560514